MRFGADTNPDHNSDAKCGAIGARLMIRHARARSNWRPRPITSGGTRCKIYKLV